MQTGPGLNPDALGRLYEDAPMGFFVINRQKQLVYANPFAVKMLGYPEGELYGKTCHNLICPRQKGNCPLFDLGEPSCGLETALVCHDGRKTPVLKSCRKLLFEGNEYAVESFLDISGRKAIEAERKRIDEQLFHAQKMASISTLATGVAHEFRNILTPILGFAEFLSESVQDPKSKEYAGVIIEAARKGADISRRIIDFSKISELEFKRLDIVYLVEKTVASLRGMVPNSIEIKVAVNTADRFIRADRASLEQALMNLALNACEAMPDGGELLFTVDRAGKPCEFKDSADEGAGFEAGFLEIRVSDNGPGMDEEVRKQAFNPFFTTKGPARTGLGLFKVYNIIEMHGGCVSHSSNKGMGTTFSVYLPLFEEPEQPGPASFTATRGRRTKRGLFLWWRTRSP